MHYILVRHLFRNNITRLLNMGIRNKFLDKVMRKTKIFRMMNYYIDTNKVEYKGGIVEKDVKNKEEKVEKERKKGEKREKREEEEKEEKKKEEKRERKEKEKEKV